MWEATKVASLVTAGTLVAIVAGSPAAYGEDKDSSEPDHRVKAAAVIELPTVNAAHVLRQADHALNEAIRAEREDAQAVAASRAADRAAKLKAEAERKAREAKKAEERREREAAQKEAGYPNSLDGWIREALAVMRQHGIPGSYAGIKRNIMRESGGDPNAVNDWDINAQNGTPSVGLLQVIKPTFDAYHVPGTAWSQYDPVANIAAACNYAAARYGSIDNVNSAY